MTTKAKPTDHLCDRCQEQPVSMSFQGGPYYEAFALCMDCIQESRKEKFWTDWDGWQDVEIRLAARREVGSAAT